MCTGIKNNQILKDMKEGRFMKKHVYIAIDLKSFYASVECVERGLDPVLVNLVVADVERSEKTICLAVSPALKAYGISGRSRLFEVVQKIKEVNENRKRLAWNHTFLGESFYDDELKRNPNLALSYITAVPRMALYIQYSARIYQIYLKYVAEEDIHVYSIDEVFIDVTNYLKMYGMSGRELSALIIQDIYRETGIPAAGGVGSNLYLCKVAMDIVAKHIDPDENGVRIAELDEISYRRLLWDHRPLTDFWRIGRGYTKKLEENGLFTMGDIARCSLVNEELLYQLFGINAELLIDHAWGKEPCTMEYIKAYKPRSNSMGTGQVLTSPYSFEKARIIIKEMCDSLVLGLVDKGLNTDQVCLSIGYDIDNLKSKYKGEVKKDHYGRWVPKPAHSSIRLKEFTSSTKIIRTAVLELYDKITDKNLKIRRLNISFNHLQTKEEIRLLKKTEQLDLFVDYDVLEKKKEAYQKQLDREKRVQETMLVIKKKYGKNAVLMLTSLEEGATAKERNQQIGGHKA